MMHRLAPLVLATCLLHSGCDSAESPPVDLSPPVTELAAGVNPLSADDADRLLNTTPTVQVIDVRTEEEFRSGHLPKALHADFFTPDTARERITALDPTLPTLIYCELGERSKQMTALLLELGFQNVFWLDSGLTPWRRERLPLIP